MELTEEETKLIEDLRREKAKQVKPSRSLASYSMEERSNAFVRLYEMAESNFRHIVQHNREEKDIETYMCEEVMRLLGADVYDIANEFLR